MNYEFRIYVDPTINDSERLKLFYRVLSKKSLQGGIPIFWPGDHTIQFYDDERQRQFGDLPPRTMKKLNHHINCSMIQIDSEKNERIVPFTISGLNFNRADRTLRENHIVQDRSTLMPFISSPGIDLYTHSETVQPGDSAPLHICMSNLCDSGINLEYGIAYACVYGPDISTTPKIVIVENNNDIYPESVKDNKIKYYNLKNSTGFKNLVRNIERKKILKSGVITYNQSW